MIALLLCLAVLAAGFMVGRSLFLIGLRNGDRPGDATVSPTKPDTSRRGITFVVRNPGAQPVLIGASVRRRNFRLLGDAGQSVSVRRRTLRCELLAGHYTVVWAIPAGEMETMRIPVSRRSIGRRAELVVAIGEPDRLRVVRQPVNLPRRSRGGGPKSRPSLHHH